jgi:hypothetical protein
MIPSLLVTLLLLVHGAIHLLGVARAFDLAAVPLQKPIGAGEGLLWGAAALLFVAAAATLWLAPQWWWVPALVGVVISQALVFGAWEDARWGTLANLLILLPALVVAADHRPGSLRATWLREVERVEAAVADAGGAGAVVTEADLEDLPAPVARWMRRVGVVGRPRPATVGVTFDIRIRGAADEAWMEGRGEQFTRVDPPVRLFFMTARKAGLPVHVLHRYAEGEATMEGRLLGLVPLFRHAGETMTRSETVTLLNDMFFLAPAALLDAGVRWEPIDDRRAGVTWSHAGHTVGAEVVFDQAGDLVDFVSDDRWQMDRDPPVRARWRTPFSAYAVFDGVRLPVAGSATWGEGDAAWPYVELAVNRVTYGGSPGRR